MANLFFGFMLADFHNFLASFSTLLRFPLGDFDYDELQVSRPSLTGIFFTMYVGMVFLVCMNMIIGIVTKYFDEVHHELKYSDKWKISTMSIEAHIAQRMVYCFRSAKKASRRGGRKLCAMMGRGPAPLSESSIKEDERERREDSSDHLQADGWARERQFTKALHKLMRVAKRSKNVDVYAYFDKVYQGSTDSSTLYIGVVGNDLKHG
eukprot:TRINITY_DN94386_c0_g1_i1.p1 TRINITY_DN94386_c0_g1~~TRINITY_DN94386_c0_g1_i1.p1  ORF type:complete len:208 (+),score=36.94 TRINITY_DN94386_c0_g1_i1:101-724(+)